MRNLLILTAALGLAGVVGLVLAAATTWWLLAVGALSMLAAWGYTGGPKPYGYLGLGVLSDVMLYLVLSCLVFFFSPTPSKRP